MFVQLAGSAGSVTKGSVQSFRAMAMAMMMMLEIHPKESGPRPGNRIFMRTIVNAESSIARKKIAAGDETRVQVLSEPSVRA